MIRRPAAMILLEKNIINQQNSLNPLIEFLITRVAPANGENNSENTVKWIRGNFKNYMLNDYPKGVENVAPNPATEKVTAKRQGMDDFIFRKPNVDDYLATSDPYWLNINDDFKQLMSHVIDYLNTQQNGKDIRGWDVPNAIKNTENWSRTSAKAKEKLDAIIQSGGRDDGAGTKIIMKFPNGYFWVRILSVRDSDMDPAFNERYRNGLQCGRFVTKSSNPVMRRETFYMHHCIGAGTAYAEKLARGEKQYDSLRDENNKSLITTEMEKAYIDQIYAFGNSEPPEEYWPYIKEYLNHPDIKAYTIENNTRFTRRLLRGKNGYVSRDEVIQMAKEDPKKLASYNLSREALRDLGLVQFNNTIMSMEQLSDLVQSGRVSTKQLKDADLTKEELEKFGLIKTKTGDVKTWAEMAGETIPTDMVFDALAVPIKFPNGVTFAKNVRFRGYPGTSLPAFTVGGDLIIEGGSITSIGAGTMIGGQLKIENSARIPILKNVTCRTLHIASPVGKLVDVRVSAGAKFVGESIEEIGTGCHFGKTFDASKTSITKVSADAIFNGHAYLMGCPIESFLAHRVRGSLLLDSAKIKTLGSPLTVGFDEGGARLDATYKDTFGGAGDLDLKGTKIKDLPRNLTVAGKLVLPSTVKVLPSGLTVNQLTIRLGSVKKLPPDIRFRKLVVKGSGSVSYTYYDPDALNDRNADLRNQDRLDHDAKPLKPGDAIPSGDEEAGDD